MSTAGDLLLSAKKAKKAKAKRGSWSGARRVRS
jgi:hypothetical protein